MDGVAFPYDLLDDVVRRVALEKRLLFCDDRQRERGLKRLDFPKLWRDRPEAPRWLCENDVGGYEK